MKSIDETKRFGLTQSLLDAVKSVVAAEAEDNRSVDQINASKVALKAAATAQKLAAGVGQPTAPGEDDMEPEDVPVDAEPEQEIPIDSDLDPVNDAENDKDFDDREDQDIDNDGDVDGSDEYLHKRRAATDDAMDAEDDQEEGLYADDEDPSDEESDEDEEEMEDEEGEESEDEMDMDDEEESDEDEEEGDEEDEDPEANDLPPEMDSDDEGDDEEGEEEPEEDDVETRNVGDMSDDELEQELAMRRKKSKDEEEVEVNPQMEAYMRKISSDVSKRHITESKLDEIAPAIGAAVGAVSGAIAGAAKKAIDAKKTIDQNKAKKTKKESSDNETNKYPDGSTIGPVSGDAGPDGGKKESWKKKMEGLTDKQKQLDVDGDGDIGGDDLAKIRAQKKEQLMASKSYYEGKYGNRWETVMDKVAEKLAQESSCGKRK